MIRNITIAATLFLCAGCGDAGHVPPPWALPGAALGSAIENASYDARRARVKAHVSAKLDAIAREVSVGGGPALDRGFGLAGVTGARRAQALASLRRGPELSLPWAERAEAVTVVLMVHGKQGDQDG